MTTDREIILAYFKHQGDSDRLKKPRKHLRCGLESVGSDSPTLLC
ncbi:hypothetical protein [Roseofilum casamattae]|nr:hypothetical protein [Roseofilum casamattae]